MALIDQINIENSAGAELEIDTKTREGERNWGKESKTPHLLQPTMLVWETDSQLLFKCLIIYIVDSQGGDLITVLELKSVKLK